MFKKIFKNRISITRLKSSQFWNGFNKKPLIKEIIKQERILEKENIKFLSKIIPWGDNLLNSYTNFQYVLEFFVRFQKEIGIKKSDITYLQSGFDDLGISLRLAMLGYYTSAYLHLRRFIESYFTIVWKIKYKSNSNSKKMEEKMKDLNNINKKENSIYFNGGELYKIYDFLSKQVHGHNKKENDNFETFVNIRSLTLLMITNMLYTFFKNEIEQNRTKEIEYPIDGERNYYRYIFGYLFYSNSFIFNNINYSKKFKNICRTEIKLDPKNIIGPSYKERTLLTKEAKSYKKQVDKFDKRIQEIIKEYGEKYRYLENLLYISQNSFIELEEICQKIKFNIPAK